MPELPEVETVRRMLADHVVGRTIGAVRLSGLRLRSPIPRDLPARLEGRSVAAARRHGKYLLLDLDQGLTLISHLGMSGRWLFHLEPPGRAGVHVHARIDFADGSALWYEDPRRFGLLRLARTERLARDRALVALGPDPIATPASGPGLASLARGSRTSVKSFLMDQRRIAGLGNIYVSEILYRARVNPRRRAGSLGREEWEALAGEIGRVLTEAIERMGTTFSMYRTLWNEPGAYGERLLVYDRAGEPCRRCGAAIRRIVQGQRSTFFCPNCQALRAARRPKPASRTRASRPRAASRHRPARGIGARA